MKIDDVRIVGGPLVLATAAEVDALADRLWIAFPDGYRDYVTRLGEGILGGSYIRIYPPGRIEKELSDWRSRIARYWSWDRGPACLPKERAAECVPVGDTLDGDELAFHPTRPGRLFILPRHHRRVFEVEGNLLDVIEWMCSSGKLTEPFDERDFEPASGRGDDDDPARAEAVVDPEGESLEDLVELARSWARRHGARRQATRDFKQHTPRSGKAKLIYEGIHFDAGSPLDVGYGIAWQIIDRDSKEPLGVFRWNLADGCQGCSYEPAPQG